MSGKLETNCETFAELLGLLASGCLPEAERTLVGRHLGDCADCRRRLEQLRLVTNSLAGEVPAWVGAAADSVLERIARELEAEEIAPARGRETGLGAALPPVRRMLPKRRRSQHRWARAVLGAVSGGVLLVATIGWFMGWWRVVPEREVAAELELAPSRSQQQRPGDFVGSSLSDYPTWLELKWSLAESEEAFQRTLARGRSAVLSRPVEMYLLLEELTQ